MGDAGIELFTQYGSGLFQSYHGKGFSFWHNRYLFSRDTTLQARVDMPVLELHITRKGMWKGAWDGIDSLDLHPGEFNLTYTPHVMTSALFRKNSQYRSCDIHFDFSYLQSLAGDFPSLDQFLSSVMRRQAVSVSVRNHHCTREMMKAVDEILDNPFGPKAQTYILESKVRLILTEALEKVAVDTGKQLPELRRSEKEALQHVRQLIESSQEAPLTHTELAQLSGLNECVLKRGFKMLFGQSPYQYHVQLKMNRAKEMLVDGNEPIDFIAYTLGYSQVSSFGHEFKKVVGLTPAAFRNLDRR